jgi:ferredoxin
VLTTVTVTATSDSEVCIACALCGLLCDQFESTSLSLTERHECYAFSTTVDGP